MGDDFFSGCRWTSRSRGTSASTWGVKWNPGDVLGAANLDSKSLSYSINGKTMGVAFSNIDFRGCRTGRSRRAVVDGARGAR